MPGFFVLVAVRFSRLTHSAIRSETTIEILCRYHVRNGGMDMIVGYARVSTDGQTLDTQEAALKAARATRVYSEKISGTVTDRRALARAITSLDQVDTLLVTRLDRHAPHA